MNVRPCSVTISQAITSVYSRLQVTPIRWFLEFTAENVSHMLFVNSSKITLFDPPLLYAGWYVFLTLKWTGIQAVNTKYL